MFLAWKGLILASERVRRTGQGTAKNLAVGSLPPAKYTLS